MSMITVYSKPDCGDCNKTKNDLNLLEIPYVEINMMESKESLKHVRSLGYKQAPVLETQEGSHWAGYSEKDINNFAAKLKNVTVEEIASFKQNKILSGSTSARAVDTSDDDWDF